MNGNGNWLKWMHLNERKDVVDWLLEDNNTTTSFPSNNDVNSFETVHQITRIRARDRKIQYYYPMQNDTRHLDSLSSIHC